MINVLHVADKLSVGDATIHGVTQLFSMWLPRFDRNRYRVSLCSLRTRDSGGGYLEEKGIRVLYLNKGKFNPLTLTDLLQLVRKEDVHVLHLHGYGSTTFGRICANLTGIPCIVHEHMFDENIPFYQQLADRLLSRSTTGAIAVSQSVKDFLVRYRSLPAAKVNVIYNGVSLEAFSTCRVTSMPPTDGGWKARLNIPSSHKVVGTVGRLHNIKGHKYFLEAAQQVLKVFKDVSFLIIGDGELMPTLRDLSNELGIEANVIFTGHCDEVPSLLSEVDIKVIASLSEGVPMTLFEAMAAGCAVVSTDVGGIGEVLVDEETGFLVPPKNSEALAEKILMLLDDPILCQKMRTQAKTLSLRYDLKNTVHQMEEIYEQLYRKRYGNGK